jgi:hypothetical protein
MPFSQLQGLPFQVKPFEGLRATLQKGSTEAKFEIEGGACPSVPGLPCYWGFPQTCPRQTVNYVVALHENSNGTSKSAA